MDHGANAGRATERTDREWLSWALQFAQANLKSRQEQDWRNALAETMAFGASHDEFAHAQLPLTMLGPRKNLKLSLEQIETALRSAQKALRRFIGGLERSIHVPLMNAEIPFKGTCVFFVWNGQPEVRYLPTEKTVTKQLTIEMLVRTGELFLRGDLSQLRRCPGCQRWFLAARHRRFDTPECRMRHRIRLLNGKGGVEATSAPSPGRRGSPAAPRSCEAQMTR
jgi:hypothetical protein